MVPDQLLFEQHPSPVLIYDLETLHIVKANKAFAEKYRYSREEIERGEVSLKQIRPEEDVPQLLEAVERIRNEGISERDVHRHRAKDGTLFYVKVTAQQYGNSDDRQLRLVVCHDITPQVEAEQKSAGALKELQHHIGNSPLAYVKWDQRFRIMAWSKQAQDISGYTEEEVLGKSLFSFDFYRGEAARKIKEQILLLVKGERDRNQFETLVSLRGAPQMHIRIHSSALRNEKGELQSVLTLIEDITEQKRSEIKYRRLFENANDSIFIMRRHRFVDCNKQAEVLFKAPKSEIVGKTPAAFSPERQPDGSESKELAVKRIDEAISKGKNMFEWQHRDTAGRLIDVEVSLNKVEFPDGEYVQAIVRDITSKKQIQAKLRKSGKLFRNLFLKSPAALVMVDADDRVQLVNESFEKMFGYHLVEIEGENIDQLIVPEEDQEQVPKMKSRGYVARDFQIEGVRISKDGTEKHVLIAGMPVMMDDEPVAGLGMYIDISDRKRSERELKKSLDEKRVLLEEVHHRVKNNLAVISGLLQMQTMNVDDERLTKYIQNSQLRIQSMAIVHEMLYQSSTLSEIEFKKYVQKLAEVIADVLEPRAKNIGITISADDFVLNLNQAIPCALVISELITNAYEYAFEGREEGVIRIDISETGNIIRIALQDDGIGLPGDFEERRQKSLGINLMENLCMQLETEIQIESGEWGTRFFFDFERDDKPGSSSSNRLRAEAPPSR